MLDRFDHRLRNQLEFVVDAAQMLHHIEQQSSTTAEQFTAMSTDDGTILQFDSC